ncbi:Delay of germination [Thalictrum thalictroides]|uniref:Delay of germination n=1 Tax=Thalictrum thalictroides TaxID=46969 RepID=A0A7J6W4I2_THATH|nr:Delay of germination [Thalictrum thalictroides]
MQSQAQDKFSQYYEKYIGLQETNIHQLLSVSRNPSNEQQHKALVSKVLYLYKEYYTMKWAGAHEDVLGFYSPTWLSPLEIAHLWITGWKPSITFKLITSLRQARISGSSLVNLTDEQVKRLEKLRLKISEEEEKVEREMERHQVSIADKKMLQLARLSTGQMKEHKEIAEELKRLVDVAMNNLLVGLEKMMKAADCVRLKAIKEVLDLLTPLQSVDFMVASLMLQIQLRNWGKRRHSRTMI